MKQYDENNIFAKLIKGRLPVKKVYEDDNILAFHDMYPAAPVHVLVVPKEEYINFSDFMNIAGEKEIGNFFKKVAEIASELGLEDYRLITNNGPKSGQTIFHFHVHILGGKEISGLVE